MDVLSNGPISVYRLGEMPIHSCGQSDSAPRGKAGARLNAHTELRAMRQRSAQEAIYRNPKSAYFWQTRPAAARFMKATEQFTEAQGRDKLINKKRGSCGLA
jgi:hypothetical protein